MSKMKELAMEIKNSNMTFDEAKNFFASYNQALREQHNEHIDNHDCHAGPEDGCECGLIRETV